MGTRELDPAGAFLSAQGGRGQHAGAEPAMEAPSSFNIGCAHDKVSQICELTDMIAHANALLHA